MPSHCDRFNRLWRELESAGDPRPVASDLLRRWSEPHRHYHNLDHLDQCIAGLDTYHKLAGDAPAVEAALWFHDAIYDPRATDNEIRSAALAREVFTRANVSSSRVDRIEQLILATRTHQGDGSPDVALLLDLDLTILGASPDAYARYAGAIRLEYAWVPEVDYRHKRADVLRRFLTRPALFLTGPLRQLLESQARQNLTAEITLLVLPAS
jgi:predicted metal-dependent HD superfamily phosphohydrolase